jgi:hypothetical protein
MRYQTGGPAPTTVTDAMTCHTIDRGQLPC